ncbi:MAG: hypothetical protein R3C52_15340 [Hyphomonadaceae bacterium]
MTVAARAIYPQFIELSHASAPVFRAPGFGGRRALAGVGEVEMGAINWNTPDRVFI